MEKTMYWYNYKTGEHEYIDTPQDFTDYIPQIPAAQNMYRLCIEMGETPIQAALRVLSAACGGKSQDSVVAE